MRKSWLKKGLVCGIIVLFVRASVVTSTRILTMEHNISLKKDKPSSETVFT